MEKRQNLGEFGSLVTRRVKPPPETGRKPRASPTTPVTLLSWHHTAGTACSKKFQVIRFQSPAAKPSNVKLFSTSCETLFLGWDAPLLPRAATLLRERYATRHRLDLSSLICVLPASHSARRLLPLLRREAESHDLQFDPPEILTVGQLAERLYEPVVPVALEFEQTLAWARVLRSMHPDDLQPLIPTIPAADPIGPWLELAGALRRLHEELSASQLSFDEGVDAAETDAEKRRWKLLRKLYTAYLSELGGAGLSDPHQSRRDAILNDRCRTDRTVALIGTSDLSDALVGMMRSLDSDLIAMIAAPQSAAFRFDEFGCVDTEGWLQHHLPVHDENLISAGDVADQSTAVAETLSVFANDFSADQVTVGVTDQSQVGPLELELRGCGVSTYRHLGWTVTQTSIGRLFDLTSTYLHRRTWPALAALVRHADVCAMITRRLNMEDSSTWLAELDELLSDFYPVQVRDPLSPASSERCAVARKVGDLVEQWLGRFSQADQPIANWSVVIGQWLNELHEQNDADAESGAPDAESGAPDAESGAPDAESGAPDAARSRSISAVAAVHRLVDRFAKLNNQLDLTVSGGAAIEMLAGRLADIRVADSAKAEDVEILGWLDLALDDAPAMVVTGLNHPFVPGAVTSDPFLPGSLRSKLRMADNDRRFARDIYAMHLMLSSRSAIRFIVGRTAADQSPTPPSRLLAASPTVDTARRVRKLIGGTRERVIVHHRWDDGPDQALMPIPSLPKLDADNAIDSMSVTAFRDYLACPYRFFLRHVLKLRPIDDASSELAANQFGDLVHGALERFGDSADRNDGDRSRIESALLEHLHEYAAERYGDSVSTAVTLQIAQAERRLRAVADAQSARIADGWTIHASEASVDEKDGAGIDVDGIRMGLRGRFDRIDHHAASGRWAILDYKTHGHRPEKKHLQKTDEGYRWIDLQLPLYRMMIPFLGIDADPADVQLGYFNVSEKDEETRINVAQFSEDQSRNAEQLIVDCIRSIRSGKFEPTSDRIQFDDYGMILQTGVASRLLDEAESFLGEEVEA